MKGCYGAGAGALLPRSAIAVVRPPRMVYIRTCLVAGLAHTAEGFRPAGYQITVRNGLTQGLLQARPFGCITILDVYCE